MAAGAWSRWLQCIYCLVTMYLPSGSRERWKVGAHLAFSFHPAWNSHPVYGMAPLTVQVSLYTSMNVIYVILHSLSRSLSFSWCSTLSNWQSVLPIMITIHSLRHLQWKHLKFFLKVLDLFYMSVWPACMYICPMRACWVPWNWSYRWLGMEFRSPARVESS